MGDRGGYHANSKLNQLGHRFRIDKIEILNQTKKQFYEDFYVEKILSLDNDSSFDEFSKVVCAHMDC